MATHDGIEIAHPKTRAEWRRWLERNHARVDRVWLASHRKHVAKPSVSYDDAVEEALCFGWIDSRAATLDDDRSLLMFTPRKPGSGWSRTNKERVARLERAGLLAPAGLEAIRRAKENGAWELLDSVEALEVPDDLATALGENPRAQRNYDAFSRSARKRLLTWLVTAKRPETRAKRIAAIVEAAADDRVATD